ncbi:MAG: ShET2/EspL2 family type III secretion system effector toxin [Gammaproteobacteria bacterium]|nr:ShET2/EspL2 family type III secretion system effector toxin [Gammaproteobacteria bacterium]MCH9763952.1 ShET2/EspL2 family type III secretion system effector toxin [Gammaproteobacteria bacterium]
MPIETKKEKLEKEKRPYVSKKNMIAYRSKAGFKKQLNGRGRDAKGERIVCRQLASYVAFHKDFKDYPEDLSSVERIKSIPFLEQNEFYTQNLLRKLTSYKIISLDALGKTLKLIARSLKQGEKKHWLVTVVDR